MPIITLISEKGGAGKSTLACHLAAEYHRRGARVLVVDTDPQGSAFTWSEVAAESDVSAPDVVAMGDQIRKALPGLAEGRDVVIVDTAGRLGKRGVGALTVSDLALVPVQPSPPDIWGLDATLDTIAQVQEFRPDLKSALVVNGKARNALSKGVRAGLLATGTHVLDAELGRRVAYAEAIAVGKGVTTYAPGTPAAKEIKKLADELVQLLSDEGQEEVDHAEAV